MITAGCFYSLLTGMRQIKEKIPQKHKRETKYFYVFLINILILGWVFDITWYFQQQNEPCQNWAQNLKRRSQLVGRKLPYYILITVTLGHLKDLIFFIISCAQFIRTDSGCLEFDYTLLKKRKFVKTYTFIPEREMYFQ